MKLLNISILALANLAFSTPVPDTDSALVKRASNAFATGTKINIDGSTTYFAGTNSYWISFLNSASDVDQTMKNIQASGLKVLRVWGFNDVSQTSSGVWFQSFVSGQQPTINTGANGLQKLDAVVAAAEKYNIKLIIPFVNYWGDYGGMEKYTTYYGVAKSDFYTNANVQTQYKKYISAVISRYKTSTSIFAWELANEPRCPGCSTSVITKWATDISAYIKSLDSSHMVAIGDEGFMNGGGDGSYPYTTAEGIDFAQNIKIKTIDVAVFHLYTDAWGVSAQPGGNNWFKNHAAICLAANKPCIAEEYGIKVNKQAVLSTWQADSLAAPGMAGDMFWQWGEQLASQGTTHDDGYTIYYGQSDWQKLVRDHVSSINAGSGTPTTTTSRVGTTAVSTTRSVTPIITSTTSRVVVPTTTTRSVTPVVTTTTSAAGGGGTVPRWGQCGGLNWTGATSCVAGSTCTYSNDWYSQCL